MARPTPTATQDTFLGIGPLNNGIIVTVAKEFNRQKDAHELKLLKEGMPRELIFFRKVG